MPSVADDVRRALRDTVRAMSATERVALTARLADDDLDLFCSGRDITRGDARRLLVRQRQRGRRPSRVMQGSPM